jgi:hypothetical protein
VRQKSTAIVRIISLAFWCYVIDASPNSYVSAQKNEQDMLIYSVLSDSGSTLHRYDPYSRTDFQVYQQKGRMRFESNSLGMVAFSTPWNWQNNGDLYLLDTTSQQPIPTNLSLEIGLTGFPLGWSQDAHNLAFASWQDEGNLRLYIWDGLIVLDITPESGSKTIESFWDIAWSPDGRLSFTVSYRSSSLDEDGPTEIFLWDGHATMNLSQNPTGEDRSAVWSANSKLAFLTSSEGGYQIVVWDGFSYHDGLPDRSSFTVIAPEMTAYYSYPTWTTDGQIAFGVQLPNDHYSQVYVWNGETATNYSQNPDAHNGGAVWSYDGYWAFVSYSSKENLIFIRDHDNNMLLATEGQYPPAWSLTNELVFCRSEYTDTSFEWILSMWDADSLSQIASGTEIYAQWQSGQKTVCSSG